MLDSAQIQQRRGDTYLHALYALAQQYGITTIPRTEFWADNEHGQRHFICLIHLPDCILECSSDAALGRTDPYSGGGFIKHPKDWTHPALSR